ncbi:MAG: carbon-nitrogen hydrolase family protein [Bacillota bacterium]|jgi:predicted amidohydrolase|nr:nitrilase-related carbon-nitrogen hydrolase [Bacillota bacterium]NLU54650.1 hypothetical protein [Bacillota bacterium]HOJ45848.1 nitrilase-related carbon-nitrogen hydrolase [Bacillota bacterium]HOL13129.1 nitrilase-related carbon-nitrogen hydrolase [Bacillota bacterium]HOP53046.1 nitrilase-related carbon-nitrogen hydrolase [Bacillota bacterium]
MKKQACTLAVVQWKLSMEDYSSVEAFAEKLGATMEEIRTKSRENLLVAFPEDLVTFGIFTELKAAGIEEDSIQEALKKYVKKKFVRLLPHRVKMGTWLGAVFESSKKLMEEYFEVFREAAEKHNAYVISGSGLVADGKDVFNESRGFGPGDAKIIQRKVNLIELEGEKGLGLTPASLAQVGLWSTELGRIGIAICYDGFFAEIREKLDGADIIVQPSANPGPWTKEQQEDWLNGAYQMVQTATRVVLNPMLTGKALGLEFYGQSSILVRGEERGLGYLNTDPKPHFVQVAKSPDEGDVLIWDLD